MSCFVFVSPKFLHNRLRHPSLAKLKLMANMLDPSSLTKSTKDVIFLFLLYIQIFGDQGE
ncbi:hypothetical protein CR513_47563, partial [Mucuna pruriens]